MRYLILMLIRIYRYAVSPYLGSSCRFYPTCSSYALEALEKHGVVKGGWLTLKRLGRCHPWHTGGVDPVPDVKPCRDCHG